MPYALPVLSLPKDAPCYSLLSPTTDSVCILHDFLIAEFLGVLLLGFAEKILSNK